MQQKLHTELLAQWLRFTGLRNVKVSHTFVTAGGGTIVEWLWWDRCFLRLSLLSHFIDGSIAKVQDSQMTWNQNC